MKYMYIIGLVLFLFQGCALKTGYKNDIKTNSEKLYLGE